MFINFLSQWNPLSCCGVEVNLDDLLRSPLQPNETLMQDGSGRVHRIKVPGKDCSFFRSFLCRIQVHLNKKGHLDAINNIISSYQKQILATPLNNTEDMKQFKRNTEKLRQLKNDYFFTTLSLSDPHQIDLKLNAIEEQAYAIFVNNVKDKAEENEMVRRLAYDTFQTETKVIMVFLEEEFVKSLYQMGLLMVSTSDDLKSLFNDRVGSIRFRIGLCHTLNNQINHTEVRNQGKFTIPKLCDHLKNTRTVLLGILDQLASEVEIFVENLKINYHINPFQGEVADLLSSLQIDPLQIKSSWSSGNTLPNILTDEIEEAKKEVKSSCK